MPFLGGSGSCLGGRVAAGASQYAIQILVSPRTARPRMTPPRSERRVPDKAVDIGYLRAHMSRVLLVDDEENVRLALRTYLRKQGYDVEASGSVDEALAQIERAAFDVVVTDVRMPGRSGLDLLAILKANHPMTTVVVMSAYGSIDQALEAIKAGAYDYVSKPFKPEELALVLRKAEERESLKRENRALREAVTAEHTFDELLAKSQSMKNLFAMIAKAAPVKITVLIMGESGVGKELVARAIHRRSPRSAKPFIAVNCGASPDALLESELFGHKRGAFTDASHDKRGLFEEAEGGTLFLDEVGELPLALQVKLLRVLQEGTFRRGFGETTDRKSDIRLGGGDGARSGGRGESLRCFREDLYYRLNVLAVVIPPLRSRREDIPLLVEHFVARYNARLGMRVTGVEPSAMKLLLEYGWPGNVRELENTIERAMVLAENAVLRVVDLPDRIREPTDPVAAEALPSQGRSVDQADDACDRRGSHPAGARQDQGQPNARGRTARDLAPRAALQDQGVRDSVSARRSVPQMRAKLARTGVCSLRNPASRSTRKAYRYVRLPELQPPRSRDNLPVLSDRVSCPARPCGPACDAGRVVASGGGRCSRLRRLWHCFAGAPLRRPSRRRHLGRCGLMASPVDSGQPGPDAADVQDSGPDSIPRDVRHSTARRRERLNLRRDTGSRWTLSGWLVPGTGLGTGGASKGGWAAFASVRPGKAHEDRIALDRAEADGAVHLGHHAALLGPHFVFHLHGLYDDHSASCFDGFALAHEHLHHAPRHRRAHLALFSLRRRLRPHDLPPEASRSPL